MSVCLEFLESTRLFELLKHHTITQPNKRSAIQTNGGGQDLLKGGEEPCGLGSS